MAWMKVGIYHYPKRKLPWLVRWYGDIDPATGKQRRYGKSFRTKREAEDFRVEKTQEHKKGLRRDKPEEILLIRLCKEFQKTWNPTARKATKDLYCLTIERLTSYFGKDCILRSISPHQADSFLAAQTHHREDPTRLLSEWTRSQITRQCKTIFKTAVRWQWITSNPFANVRMPKPITQRWHRLTVEEYYRLLEAAPTLRWKCFYALAYTSGARFGELFNLTWADVDFEQGRVNIVNKEGSDRMPPFQIKDREARFVQLPKQTIDLLVKYQSGAPEGVPYILLTKERYERVLDKWRTYRKEGKEWQNRFMASNTLRDFKIHAKRAGLKFNGKFTIHTFRKSCAQNWADRLPANVVKFYLGHSSVNTTNQFYSIVDKSHTDWTKKAMDEMLENSPAENNLDTEQTLAKELDKNSDKVQKKNPRNTSFHKGLGKWAVQDLNL